MRRARCGIIRYVAFVSIALGLVALACLLYSHEGLGKIMKELNGDYLTKITQPPENL
jgi:hypothetical protein